MYLKAMNGGEVFFVAIDESDRAATVVVQGSSCSSCLCERRLEDHVECSTCKTPMQPLGQVPIRVGGTSGGWHLLLGEWADMTEGVFPLDVFRCPTCRHVKFFDLDLSLPNR